MASKKTKKLRVAVIGCGERGAMHLAMAAAAPEVKLVACCDAEKFHARAMGKAYHIRSYTDVQKLLRRRIFRRRVQAVHVCVPHDMHASIVGYCLTRGVHVLTEKPLGLDASTAAQTVYYSSLSGRLCGVFFPYRMAFPMARVREVLASGELGRLLSVRSVLSWAYAESYYAASPWRGSAERAGGGILLDRAIHTLDLVNLIVDSEVESVSCTMANRHHPGVDVEDSAEGLVIYKNGVRYAFYCMNTAETDIPIEIRLTCEAGEVVMNYDRAEIRYRDGHSETVEAPAGFGTRPACFDELVSSFYRACRGEGELAVSAESTLATHRLVYALYDDARARGIQLVGQEAPATQTEEKRNWRRWI